MVKTKTPKRSVSPFGTAPEAEDPLFELKSAFKRVFQDTPSAVSKGLQIWNDGRLVPDFVENIREAPANNAPELGNLCDYLVKYRTRIEEEGLASVTQQAMEDLFFLKTSLFLIDHHPKEECEKLEWNVPYKDFVLFAKERDILIGRFFVPFAEHQPGQFSAFLSKWAESKESDSLLHLIDFCAGHKNPTLDHFLVFSDPSLRRLLSDRMRLRSLMDKCRPLLQKLSSPTWEKDVRKSLGL